MSSVVAERLQIFKRGQATIQLAILIFPFYWHHTFRPFRGKALFMPAYTSRIRQRNRVYAHFSLRIYGLLKAVLNA